MKIIALFSRALAIGMLVCAAQPANADVINSLPGGVAKPIPAGLKIDNKPIVFAGDVTYRVTTPTGTPTSSLFGDTGSYGFENSQNWSGTPYAAFGIQTAIMSFSFADPVSAVLAEFNWARPPSPPGDLAPITFRAFNSAGTLLESLSFAPNDSNYLTGFYGFERARNDISRFEVQGYWVGARNLSTAISSLPAVPEPAAWGMMLIGFGTAGAMVRRSRRAGVALA